MSDEKKMTAAEAWAEVDRLDKESDAACVRAHSANVAWRSADRERYALVTKWNKAIDIAEAIGPRPEVPS